MEKMVVVSLLGSRSFRPGKGQATIHYKMGQHAMPLAQARAMGLEHRIVQGAPETEDAPVANLPFDGRFDEKLSNLLLSAGIITLADLRAKSQNELMAIDGIGPAAYERIQHVLGGIN